MIPWDIPPSREAAETRLNQLAERFCALMDPPENIGPLALSSAREDTIAEFVWLSELTSSPRRQNAGFSRRR